MAEKTDYKEFLVFIDDSNLWISGQKVQGAKLHDAEIDPRFRVDLGRFLDVITGKNGSISQAFLYGSVPPPNDTVWNAARKKNFKVQTYRRSASSGKEKEIDVAMASDITEMLFTQAGDNTTFVIVTGDRDLKRPMEKVVKREIPVELWSWDQSLSRDYRRLANTNSFFNVHLLDDVEQYFSYKSYALSKKSRSIDSKHTLVVLNIPKGKHSMHIVANSVTRLMRLFYITTRSFPDRDTQDLVVEFPKTEIEVVLHQLSKYDFEYEHCTYASYISNIDQGKTPVVTTNRFEALSTIEDDSLSEAVESSLSLDPEEMSESHYDTEVDDDVSIVEDDAASVPSGGSWVDIVRKKKVKKVGHIPCRWGVHCVNASNCKYQHTEYETEVFRRYPRIKFQFWKAQLCNKRDYHSTENERKWCAFAHDGEDSWCLKCKMFDHLTYDCAV